MLGCSRPHILLALGALEYFEGSGVGAGVPGYSHCVPGCLAWNRCVILRYSGDVTVWGLHPRQLGQVPKYMDYRKRCI